MRFSRPLVLLSLIMLLSAGALAQFLSAKQMLLGQRVLFALQPAFRKELKISESQVQKITDCFEGSVTVEGDRIMLTLHGGEEDLDRMQAAALKMLDENQRKRLNEIWLQQVGGMALADDATAKALGLSDKQKADAEKMLQATADEMQDVFMSGGHDPDTQKAAQAVTKRGGDRMLGLLTEDQKKAFEKMKGEPIKKPEGKDGQLT